MSDPDRYIELLISVLEFYISDDESCIGSLVLIDLPGLSICMDIGFADLMDFWMSDHDIESGSVGHIPFIFVTDIGFIFFGFFFYLEGEAR